MSLEDVRDELLQKVIPSAFQRKAEILQDITKKQRKTVYVGRMYYYLLYKFFESKKPGPKFSEEMMLENVFLGDKSYQYPIESLHAQVIINFIKALYNQPRIFAESLINSNLSESKLWAFSILTFPSLFGFFTSVDCCEPATMLIMDLIHMGAPKNIIYNMTVAYLFSLTTFLESLWFSFYKHFEGKAFPTLTIIHDSLLAAIHEALPLIPTNAFFILRELAANDMELAATLIFNEVFQASFKIWSSSDSYILSLSGTDVVEEYFEENSTWPSNEAISVLSAMIRFTVRIEKVPSYTTICRIPREILVMSCLDIQLIIDAFSDASDEVEMFESLNTNEWGTIEHFEILLFIPLSPKLPPSIELGIHIPKCQNIEFKNDAIFEYILNEINNDSIRLAQNFEKFILKKERTKEFHEYKIKKEIALLLEAADAQKEITRLLSESKKIDNFIESRKVSMAYFLQAYIRNIMKKQKYIVNADNIINIAQAIVGTNQHLRKIAATELLNFFDVEIDDKIIKKASKAIFKTPAPSFPLVFLEDKREIRLTSKDSNQLTALSPMLVNRAELGVGQAFTLFTKVISLLEFYANRNKVPHLAALKDILRLAISDSNVRMFVIFEKVIMRSHFIKVMSPSDSSVWNMLFQAMWEILREANSIDIISNLNVQ